MPATRLVVGGQLLIEHVPGGAALRAMEQLRDVFARGDIGLCNLEVALRTAAGGFPTKDAVVHTAPAEVLDLLPRLGITAVTLANNHVGDLGPAAVVGAVDRITARGLHHAGAGADRAAASAVRNCGPFALTAVLAGPAPLPGSARDAADGLPARPGVNTLAVRRSVVADEASFEAVSRLAERSGQSARLRREAANGRGRLPAEGTVDFYGVKVVRGERPGERAEADPAGQARLLDRIRSASDPASGRPPTVVSIHYHDWEPDWAEPPEWLRRLAHACVEAGAAAVIGHGPPVTSAVEVYRERLIAYGMGNLVFHTRRVDGYPDQAVWSGFLLEAGFDERCRVVDARLHPVRLDRPGPQGPGYARLADPGTSAFVLSRTGALSRPYGVEVAGDGTLSW